MATQHHPSCEDPLCEICLNDAFELEAELLERTSMKKANVDILGRYRTFLDKSEIEAETDHGWFHANAYDEASISSFVQIYQ